MFAVLAAGAIALALVLALAAPGASAPCETKIRTVRWTAVGAYRADRLAEGIVVLGIHAGGYRLRGDGERAIAFSPRGSVAVRRAGDGFEVLGLTVVAEKGCEGEAAEGSLGRLRAFVARP